MVACDMEPADRDNRAMSESDDEKSLDERIAKLPVWAQNHISSLNTRIRVLDAEVDELRTSLETGPEGSTVFAEIGDVSRPLGSDVEISFKTEAGFYTVKVQEDGSLGVDGTVDLVIEPVRSYEVVLRLKRK